MKRTVLTAASETDARDSGAAHLPARRNLTALLGNRAFGRLLAQRKVSWQTAETRDRYRPDKNPNITSSIYKAQFDAAVELTENVAILEDASVSQGEGEYTHPGPPIGPTIKIHPLDGEANPTNQHFNDNIATLGHELQHAIDDLGDPGMDFYGKEPMDPKRWNIIHTEWKAWATQAAITFEYIKGLQDGVEPQINTHQAKMLESFSNPDQMVLVADEFFRKTRVYINQHVYKDTEYAGQISEARTREWMTTNQTAIAWLTECQAIFRNLTAAL